VVVVCLVPTQLRLGLVVLVVERQVLMQHPALPMEQTVLQILVVVQVVVQVSLLIMLAAPAVQEL
jgi:hypothetical protein